MVQGCDRRRRARRKAGHRLTTSVSRRSRATEKEYLEVLGVPLTPDFTAVGLAYFAQGALALAALAKPFYVKELKVGDLMPGHCVHFLDVLAMDYEAIVGLHCRFRANLWFAKTGILGACWCSECCWLARTCRLVASASGQGAHSSRGASGLAYMTSYESAVLAEYVWLDAKQVPRSKTMTMTTLPKSIEGLRVWNYDGSSTEQADGHNSEIYLYPKAIFKDGEASTILQCLGWAAGHWQHASRVQEDHGSVPETLSCSSKILTSNLVWQRYKDLDPWFGIEQEYTLMRPGRIGEEPKVPLGFNADGTEPAPQGPYYTGAGFNTAIGRPVADEHYKKCLEAGVKIAGINAEANIRQIRFPDEKMTTWQKSFQNQDGGYDIINKVCEAFGKVAAEHIAEYGEGNEKRLTGKHETCAITDFKYGVANRGASIRIPRETEKDGKGYMEDRRPAANCDPYKVTARMMKTTGECLAK
eukprot:g19285.t1